MAKLAEKHQSITGLYNAFQTCHSDPKKMLAVLHLKFNLFFHIPAIWLIPSLKFFLLIHGIFDVNVYPQNFLESVYLLYHIKVRSLI